MAALPEFPDWCCGPVGQESTTLAQFCSLARTLQRQLHGAIALSEEKKKAMQVKMMPMHQAYWCLNSLVLEDCRPCWKEIDRKDMVREEGNDATFLRVRKNRRMQMSDPISSMWCPHDLDDDVSCIICSKQRREGETKIRGFLQPGFT